jgi:hypothetical protein
MRKSAPTVTDANGTPIAPEGQSKYAMPKREPCTIK